MRSARRGRSRSKDVVLKRCCRGVVRRDDEEDITASMISLSAQDCACNVAANRRRLSGGHCI